MVLREATAAMEEVPEVGLPILGISHRSPWFRRLVDETEEHIRALLQLPDNYRILFLQGGSSLQFSMIPMALLRGKPAADYLVTGYWSRKSIPDAEREGPVRVIWNGEPTGFHRLPADSELDYKIDAPYFHYVSNETVEGLQFHRIVGLDPIPRICDMSSDFLSAPVDARRFALIYAHAQKNLGPSGLTVVILRSELVERMTPNLPTMLDYRTHIEHGSIYNTPPVFAIYVTLLVTRWLRYEIGGLEAMERINRAKAQRLYAALETHPDFYRCRAAVADRSDMNVVFSLANPALESAFLAEAEAVGLHGLEGHRTIGGLRASLYNAVTLEAVDDLCEYLEEFRSRHAD
jgi:phosphoserine aminotransferase